MSAFLPEALAAPAASPLMPAALELASLARDSVSRGHTQESSSQLPPEVQMARLRLYDRVERLVKDGQDDVINLSLAVLGGEAAALDLLPLMLMSDMLDDVTLDHCSPAEEPLLLMLVPLMLACPPDGRELVLPADAVSELYDVWSSAFSGESLYFVDPVLWRSAQVYDVRYRDVAELRPAEENDDLAAEEGAFEDGTRLGLRFLALWVAMPDDGAFPDMPGTGMLEPGLVDDLPECPFSTEAAQTDSPDWLDRAGDFDEGDGDGEPRDDLDKALLHTEALLEDLTGQVAYALSPSDFYTARRKALGFRAHYEAFDLITLQLDLGCSQFTSRELHLACSMHGVPDAVGSEEGIVDELRVSILSPSGDLLAWHAISLQDRTLDPKTAVEIAVGLAGHFADGKVKLIDGLHDTRGESGTGPLYFAGPQYLSGGQRPAEGTAPGTPPRAQLH